MGLFKLRDPSTPKPMSELELAKAGIPFNDNELPTHMQNKPCKLFAKMHKEPVANLDPSRLKHYRQLRGMTQADAGRAMGYESPAASWSNYETGRNRASHPLWQRMAAVLGVNSQELSTLCKHPLPPLPQDQYIRGAGPKINPDRLRHYRKFRGMTQAEAGRAAGYPYSSASAWSAYENGNNLRPKPEQRQRLAMALGVPVEQILDTCKDPLPPLPPSTDLEARHTPRNAATSPQPAPASPSMEELNAAYEQGHADGYAAGYAAGIANVNQPEPSLEVIPTPPTQEDIDHAPETQPEQLPPNESGPAPGYEQPSDTVMGDGLEGGPEIIRLYPADS